jgi:hypothetical protein
MSPRFFKTVVELESPPLLEVLRTRKIAWTLSKSVFGKESLIFSKKKTLSSLTLELLSLEH